jgi:hypothetical protein
MDLSRVGTLGMLDFTARGEGALAPVARQQFLTTLQSAQPGTPVLELGAPPRVLADVGRSAIDPETVRAIGKKHGIDALLVGELRTAEMKPSVSMRDLSSLRASMEIEGALDARIYETRSGATIWTTTAAGRVPVAKMAVSSWGDASLKADQMEQARLTLVRDLVEQATSDFQPRWVYP